MNNQILDQLTTKALNTIYLFSKGKNDVYFPQMREVIELVAKMGYLEGRGSVFQEQLDEITNSKQK